MKEQSSRFITYSAAVAALYVVLTLLAHSLGLSNGVIQVRFSEALTILPLFTPAAIPGLTIGCLLSNLITGCIPGDVVFGSLATLIGAIGTYLLRKKHPVFGTIPPIAANTLIVPFILVYMYHMEEGLPFLFLTVGIGEIISCGILGMILYPAFSRTWRVFEKKK